MLYNNSNTANPNNTAQQPTAANTPARATVATVATVTEHPAHTPAPAQTAATVTEHPAHTPAPAQTVATVTEHPAHTSAPAQTVADETEQTVANALREWTVCGDDIPMDWDAPLEDGEGPYILPEGDYTFTVTRLKRGRFPGSAKMPSCNEAEITAAVETDRGPVTVRFNLMLLSGMKWRIASFFRCMGLKKPGETCRPDWQAVTGRMGRAHFKPRGYTNASGQQKQANSVAYFIDYDPAFFKATEEIQGFTPVGEELPF